MLSSCPSRLLYILFFIFFYHYYYYFTVPERISLRGIFGIFPFIALTKRSFFISNILSLLLFYHFWCYMIHSTLRCTRRHYLKYYSSLCSAFRLSTTNQCRYTAIYRVRTDVRMIRVYKRKRKWLMATFSIRKVYICNIMETAFYP